METEKPISSKTQFLGTIADASATHGSAKRTLKLIQNTKPPTLLMANNDDDAKNTNSEKSTKPR
ncbi:hypothetical protein OsJ_23152 [Oryza sativa Japonica Group]|uniref:Uncharacterized protein n=2 Tax=Oryza TaxID=4527 RepID=Q6Z126_ORYSJ|nr:hypothetical protein OsJ_23152 [Oryza sativa Japonica Group]BAC84334.1 hypothetical protein [Oryza sativa Japonica Group]